MQSLTPAEVELLSAGAPPLARFSSQLLVAFDVCSLSRAKVLWLNTRWFTRRGLAIQCDEKLRSRTETWVLEQFAIGVGDGVDGERTVHADRYGDPRGTSPHGGSGRVATIGNFQVKGIGRTPLVGEATWIHSHGQMSLTEAICETIFGEILDQELPFGAVPVIAIIDCGEIFRSPQGELRRALIVRPAALRPAHLLRAPAFVPSPAAALVPSPDATRVREVIAHLASMSAGDRTLLNLPGDIAEHVERLACQAAAADVLRMFTGGLFAGNVSLDGAILDFGVARALYSWASVQVHAHAQGFGRDLDRIANSATAIQFYARKAMCAEARWFVPQVDPASLRQTYLDAQQEMFGRMWSDEFLDEDSRQTIRDATRKYFEFQQGIRLRERWDGKRPSIDWIHDTLIHADPPTGSGAQTPEWELASSVRDVLRRHGRVAQERCWRSASRLLQPRAELDRARLERRVERVLRDAPESEYPDRIARLIEGTIGRCRRWWPNLPSRVAVTSQHVRHGCSALECSSGEPAAPGWWIEGLVCADRCVWGTSTLTEAQVKTLRPAVGGQRWHCTLGADELPAEIADQLSAAAQLNYPAPPQWWTE